MPRAEVHHCECPHCQQEMPHPDQELHRQMNLLLIEVIASQRQVFQAAGSPIISVDTKKKEWIGNFKNAGRAWGQEAETGSAA